MSGNNGSGNISFLGLLFIVLLVLKLTDTIDWSWFWITAPLWGFAAGAAVVYMSALFVYAMIRLYEFIFKKI